jgi:hypothetical protein
MQWGTEFAILVISLNRQDSWRVPSSCSSVEVQRRLRGTYRLHLQGRISGREKTTTKLAVYFLLFWTWRCRRYSPETSMDLYRSTWHYKQQDRESDKSKIGLFSRKGAYPRCDAPRGLSATPRPRNVELHTQYFSWRDASMSTLHWPRLAASRVVSPLIRHGSSGSAHVPRVARPLALPACSCETASTFPSSGILENRICFRPQVRGWEDTYSVGPLGKS